MNQTRAILRVLRNRIGSLAVLVLSEEPHDQGVRWEMRVIVCGGRNFSDWEALKSTLDFIHAFQQITEIIEGGALGADLLANCWGAFNGIKLTTVRADWWRYKTRAGLIRNVKMADMKPDFVIAMPGGSETMHMVGQCRMRGIQVTEVKIKERA